MTWRNEEERRPMKWLPFGLAFLFGLLLGWWVIGWWLWPVSYTNALPPDLRSQEKQQYLMMVADSYAVTGNVGLAQQRTETWAKDKLATDLSTLQTSLAQQNPVEADNVRRLATALNASAGAAPGQAPGQAAPKATAAPAASGPSLLQRLCPGALWVALILAGIAVIFTLWTRWRQAQPGQGVPWLPGQPSGPARSGWPLGRGGGAPADDEAPSEPSSGGGASDASFAWRPGAPGAATGPAEASTLPYNVEDDDTSYEPDNGQEAYPAAGGAKLGQSPAASRERASGRPGGAAAFDASPAEGTAATGPAAAATGARLTKVDEYSATYYGGESGYDQAFDITDVQGNLGSQCGLQLVPLPGAREEQPAGFKAWLWDAKDRFTQAKVLMSDGAYRDTALRDQLANGDPPVAIKPGTEFDLETRRFVLYGKVDEIQYADQDPRNQIFRRMTLQLKVYQKV